MKYFDLKDKAHFKLFGSDALEENGYNRLFESERQQIEPINSDVSFLGTQCAGIMARFKTNATRISIKTILNSKPNMPHMPATGQCGVDLYVYDSNVKKYVLHDVSIFSTEQDTYEVTLGHFESKEERKYILNLPLYMGVKEIKVGIEEDCTMACDTFANDGRIVVYGTSITQGGCVSRPGMLYTHLLSRWLDYEFLNFGFSGAAFGEHELAEIIASRENQKLLIIDIEANAGVDERMEENLSLFISTYKKEQPDVPIILVSRILFAMDCYDLKRIKLREHYRKFLKKLTKQYVDQGEKVSFLDGSKIFKGDFTEYTVDGIHPTDLGSMQIAKAYYKEIMKVLIWKK